MKKFLTLALAVLMLATLAITASASADGECKGLVPQIDQGVITVDGEMDEIYASALKVEINQFLAGEETGTYGDAYMLWCEGSFYFFAEIHDADVQIPTETMQKNTPWNTDSVEMFFDFGNAHAGDVHQFRLDFSGFPSYYKNQTGDEQAYGPEQASVYFDEFSASQKDYGYNIEMKVAFKMIGVTLKQGDSIGLQLQINDMTAANPSNTTAIYNMDSSNNAGSWDADLYDYVTLGEKLVVDVPTPVEEPTPADPTPVAPATQTADLAVIAVIALGAFAVAKKH